MIRAIRIQGHFKKTLLLTIFIFVFFGAALETLARSSLPDDILLAPSLGMPNRGEESLVSIKLSFLNRLKAEQENIDCIFIGSSMVNNSISVETFITAYQETTGEPLVCFNFGVPQMHPDLGVWLAEYLIKTYQPKFLLYGTGVIEYRERDIPEYLAESDWFDYVQGNFNLNGWLLEYSYTYRYYLRYSDWASPELKANLFDVAYWQQRNSSLGTATVDIEFRRSLDAPLNLEIPNDRFLYNNLYNYRANVNKLAALERVAQFNQTMQTRIFIIEMPVYPSFMHFFEKGEETYQAEFIAPVAAIAEKYEVPFWQTMGIDELSDDTLWEDYLHMRPNGSALFSSWLGQQFGEAVIQGLWKENAPPELFHTPPLARTDIQLALFFPTYGLSEEHYQTYLEHKGFLDEFFADALIFTPDTYAFRADVVNIGLAIEQGQIEIEPYQFDMMGTLARVLPQHELNITAAQRQSLDAWSQSGDPQDLIRAGISYIVYTEKWLAGQPNDLRTWLTGTGYALLQTWQHPIDEEFYFLYELANNDGVIDSNLISNGNFQNGTSHWALHGDMNAFVEEDTLYFARDFAGTSGWALLSQLMSDTIEAESTLVFSAEFGNVAGEAKTVEVTLKSQNPPDEKTSDGGLTCQFILAPHSQFANYGMEIRLPATWNGLELSISDSSEGTESGYVLLRDAAILRAPGKISESACIMPIAPEDTGLVLNGKFQDDFSFWKSGGDMSAFVEEGILHFAIDPDGSRGWATISQLMSYTVEAEGTLVLSAEFGNAANQTKTVEVALKSQNPLDEKALTCHFILVPGSQFTNYGMEIRLPATWNGLELKISDLSGGTEPGYVLLRNVEVVRASKEISRSACILPAAPEAINLVLNGDFQESGFSPWHIGGDMSAFVEEDTLHFATDPDGSCGWALISQSLAYAITPDLPLVFSAQISNPSDQEKTFRLVLRRTGTNEQGVASCEFTLAPRQLPQIYTLTTIVPQEWDSVEVIIADVTNSDQLSYAVLDNVAVTLLPETAITQTECTPSVE